jgi:hypothetical protein
MKTSHKSVPVRGRSVLATGLLAFGLAIAAQSASAGPLTASTSQPRAAAEGQAVVTELGGNAKAVTYWSQGSEGAVVVTTVDTVSDAETASERHAVVRLTSVLQPGQVQEISVPLAVGQSHPVLRIEHAGDQITVSKVTQ